MWKKILFGALFALIVGILLIYFFRVPILTFLVLERVKLDRIKVAPYQEVVWQQGPSQADIPISDRPPNIVLILLDDLGINDISTFGGGVANGMVPTPNIDKLAAQGALFTQAYSGTGTCAPSRAMLLTGRYPTRSGFQFTPTPEGFGHVVSMIGNSFERGILPPMEFNQEADQNRIPYDDMGLPASEITIAELLKDYGYHTVHIGKWHLGRSQSSRPTAQGFDESLLMHSGLYLPENDPNVVNAKLDFDPIDKFLWARLQFSASFNMGQPFEPGSYITDWWTEESLKVIEANRNRPFFLYLAHWGVHTPLQATMEDYESVGDIKPHRLRVYAAMVRSIDRSVGQVMTKLEEEGLADNTIVVLSSDNGGAGYIDLPNVNKPYRGWKITLFEGGIRVPMMVKWPAKIQPGTVIDEPVAHIDVMPTFISAADGEIPTNLVIDGQDMLPIATGSGKLERPNDALFWQSGFYQVVRAGDWKLQVDGRQNKVWLFDLKSDPTEQINQAKNRPDKLSELQSLLDSHHKDAVEPLYPHTLESPMLIDKTTNSIGLPGDEYVYWPN